MMSEVLESRSEDNLEDKKEKKVSYRTGYAGNCLLDYVTIQPTRASKV